MKGRRVVITGLGVVAPNGIGKDEFWRNLVTGKSAVDYITAFDASSYHCQIAAQLTNFEPRDFVDCRKAKTMGRFSQFAVAAATLALNDSFLNPDEFGSDLGLCFGTTAHGAGDIGEQSHLRFIEGRVNQIHPMAGLEYTAAAAASHIMGELNMKGPSITLASGCGTGLDALIWGFTQVNEGKLKAALVGATDAPITPYILTLFSRGGFLTKWSGPASAASRPYDRLRSGFVLSEGAGAVIVEDRESAIDRGAMIYAEVSGFANKGEGRISKKESPYRRALVSTLEAVFSGAGLSHDEVDYINSHGNSTQWDDASETSAYKEYFGARAYHIPVSSIKSMVGQAFSAGSMMQIVSTALTLTNSIIPPTINYETPDPACDLDYVPNIARAARIRHALVHSHSMGGLLPGSHSAVLLSQAN